MKRRRKDEVWRVTRYGPGFARKRYGPFSERDLAERVALRAAEKHPGAVVSVEERDAEKDVAYIACMR